MEQEICIRTINENIKNVFEGKALTMPLSRLNKDCKFRKMYDAYCDITEGDLKKEKAKEYYQRPEVKAYYKEYKKEYNKEYYQRPEVKARMKEYYQKNKEKAKEYYKEYNRKNRKIHNKIKREDKTKNGTTRYTEC